MTSVVRNKNRQSGEDKMRSVELFSGCGGLAFGLSKAGFHHEMMAEWNAEAVTTVLHNKKRGIRHVKDWPIEQLDVREISWRTIVSDLDLVAGGPPCQPFSIGGKHQGHDDSRDMWPEAVRAVRETAPRGFMFENVRGLARPAFGHYLRWILAHLRHPDLIREPNEDHVTHTKRLEACKRPAAYDIIVLKVNAADFGAPQKRHRVIIAGLRADLGGSFAAPEPTHSRERLLWDQWVTGDYWRRHNLPRRSDSQIPSTDLSLVLRLRKLNIAPTEKPWVTVRDALFGLGEPNGKSNHVLQPGARTYPGHTGSPLDQPAKALKAGDHGVPGGENMMVLDNGGVRYFTTREAARLQGLPDTYLFPRSWSESMRQLGNAVPTHLAEHIGHWMADTLTRSIDQKVAA